MVWCGVGFGFGAREIYRRNGEGCVLGDLKGSGVNGSYALQKYRGDERITSYELHFSNCNL